MLNKDNERELAYVARVQEVVPIEGYDRVEHVRISAGWWVVCKKGDFKAGDLCIYIEPDAKVPATEQFDFMEKCKYRVKTIRLCHVRSEGLIIKLTEDLPEGTFLTKQLGITYYEPEDNSRKANLSKYDGMKQRHKKLFKNKLVKKLMNYNWFRELMFMLFGKKRDKKNAWPAWVQKTDEERCQNIPELFRKGSVLNEMIWVATEKIDGTSTTFTVKDFGLKRKFYVCSRNVVFDKPDKKCFYEENVYTKMAARYNVEAKMGAWLDSLKYKNVVALTLQGETFGKSVQNRDYGMTDQDIRIFNIIYVYADGHTERLNPKQGEYELALYTDMEFVPIIGEFKINDMNCEQLLEYAGGKSKIDGGMREGLVFRSLDGTVSFKAVDPNFLMKYHA